MIVAPEFTIKDVIQNRLNQLYANPNLLDGVFAENANNIVSKLKELFKKPDKIKVIMGFPRDPSQLPCYVITLGSSTQHEMGLGMNLDVEYPQHSGVIQDYTVVLKPTVMPEDGTIYIKLPEIIDTVNHIEQDGFGVEFEVKDSHRGIVQILDNIDTEQELSVNYNYFSKVVVMRGAAFQETYRVESWSDNGDLTAYMYLILRWILLSSIQFLTDNGFILPSLQGMDFEPVPDYFPTFVYRRSLNINTQVENSWEEWDEALRIDSAQFTTGSFEVSTAMEDASTYVDITK